MTPPRLPKLGAERSAPPRSRRASRREPHGGGQWREEGSGREKGRQPLCWARLVTGGSRKSRECSRAAGGPSRRPSQGHVARGCPCRRGPRVGRATGGWPRGGAEGRGAGPCRRLPQPSLLATWHPRATRPIRLGAPGTSGRVRPTHPAPVPGH